jgi:CheY-like chemotaxis protein
MPGGGKLLIGTKNIRLDDTSPGKHAGLKPGSYVMLWVSDTGKGMPKNTLDHIFEPFFTTKDSGKGTGLGLSTVYGIVKSHNGHIVCESEPDVGTTFWIYLPALPMEGEVPAGSETEDSRKIDRGTEKILFVDDEAPTRQYGKELLEQYGYEVKTAASGEEALEILIREKDSIDLVALDLIMAGMGGRRCLDEMLKIDPHLRVLVMTGYADDDLVLQAVEEGAREVLRKPFRDHELAGTIRRLLDQKPQDPQSIKLQSTPALRVVN